MTAHRRQPGLANSHQIGILGATHGDVRHLAKVLETLSRRGAGAALVLGDFGFIWPSDSYPADLDAISDRLSAHGQILYFVDGNHEDFTTLNAIPISDDGLRWVRPNVAHLPRGYRTALASGATFAALGGANSIDKHRRVEGRTWWPEESITEDDLLALGQEPVDILVGLDAPLPLPSLDAALALTGRTRPEEMRAYARAGRQQFHRGFLQVRPKLYLGGHYPLTTDETVAYGQGLYVFETRVMLLSSKRSAETSQGILNVHTGDVEMFRRDDSTVTELTGMELGHWRVETQRSHYAFDLDAQTVTRHPGGTASATINDTTRPLRLIERCRVGELGAWTMHPAGGHADPIDFYWQVSTEIRSIERIADPPDAAQRNPAGKPDGPAATR